MLDIFKAEFRRFLPGSLVYAFVHLAAMLFLTRVADMAQQPDEVYLAIAAVHALTGLLLGLFQMGAYRRPNAWLNLLHRPLAHWRIGLALLGAGTALLVIALLLPLLATAAWQETMTPRVLDLRHVGLCVAAFAIGVIGYFTGTAAMLVPRRTAVAPLVFLALLPAAYATGVGFLVLLLGAASWLLALTLAAFKPDLGCAPRGAAGVLLAAPMQAAMWLALVLAGFGFELLWIAQGSHPNSLANAPAGSAKQAESADGADLLVDGLVASTQLQAPLWREQAAISDILSLGLGIPVNPMWNELGNRAPMEFDDEERRIRWAFSHDLGRFVGYSLTSKEVVGELGVDGDARFPWPPLPGPEGLLVGRDTVHQFDRETQRVLPRLSLPPGELMAGLQLSGERLAVLSDRALYLYDARPLSHDRARLATVQRVPLPDAVGNLTRVDIMELVDGQLASFTMTRRGYNGGGRSFQRISRVDEQGQVQTVAHRELSSGYGPLFTWQTWWLSPVLDRSLGALRHLLAPHQPGQMLSPPSRPESVRWLAAVLLALALLLGVLHARRTALGPMARVAWCLACGVVGLPALLAFWLGVPPREVIAPAAQAAPAPA